MPIKLKNIAATDKDNSVWRYMPFSKYISLLSYGAVWFSKLSILLDKYEGAMPLTIQNKMRAEHSKMKERFHPSLKLQFDQMTERNVSDGRELTAVSCWFESEIESDQMWREYGRGDEGIAIRSTIGSLSETIDCDLQLSEIGRTKYVDLDTHEMTAYEANQAHERAFLKQTSYAHEREIRIATMNFRGPMCIGIDGIPLRPQDWEGAGMNNFDNPGLYIRANIRKLIHSTVVAPNASPWFEFMVRNLARQNNLGPVQRSRL